jgi:hypothetical protein
VGINAMRSVVIPATAGIQLFIFITLISRKAQGGPPLLRG